MTTFSESFSFEIKVGKNKKHLLHHVRRIMILFAVRMEQIMRDEIVFRYKRYGPKQLKKKF